MLLRASDLYQEVIDLSMERLMLIVQRRLTWIDHCRGGEQGEPAPFHLGMDRGPEIAFYAEDGNARALDEEIARFDAAVAFDRESLASLGRPHPIDILRELFGLGVLDEEVLFLLLAPELRPDFTWLFSKLQGGGSHPYPTPSVAGDLFDIKGEDGLEVIDRLQPEAPLRHFGMVDLFPGDLPLPLQQMKLSTRIAGYLRGIDMMDEQVQHLLRPIPKAPTTSRHSKLAEGIERVLRNNGPGRSRPVVNLIGPKDMGRTEVARAMCDALNIGVYALDVGRLAGAGLDTPSQIPLIERDAALSSFVILVDDADVQDLEGPSRRSVTSNLVDAIGTMTIVTSADRFPTTRDTIPVRVPVPDAKELKGLWKDALGRGEQVDDAALSSISQHFGFGPRAIVQAVNSARSLALVGGAEPGVPLKEEDLWNACREQVGTDLGSLAQRIEPCFGWDDIVLPEDDLEQLREIADQVANRGKVYDTWEFRKVMSRGRGISALFTGPSGTGKTMAAEIIASHLGLDLYRANLAGIISKWVGETEKNLQRVFDAAERSGAILFFDEADALFGRRTQVRDSHDRYANVEVDFLLQRMEDYRGLAVLATNRKSALDTAFLRRIRFVVDFPFPDRESRRRIWRVAFPKKAKAQGLDYKALSRLEISGGNIHNIAVRAAFMAAAEGAAGIGMGHVLKATRREYDKIGKMITEAEFGEYYGQVVR